MSADYKRRNVQVLFRLTREEHDLMRQKMASIGIVNQEAFIRKMVLDGYILRLELPELKELLKLLRNISNNINQIAKRVNESGRVYEADLVEIKEKQGGDMDTGECDHRQAGGAVKGKRGYSFTKLSIPFYVFFR